MRPPLIVLTLIVAVFCVTTTSLGQIEAQVTTNLDQFTGSSRYPLVDFAADVQRYINTNKWTSEDIGNDKIQISITISVALTGTQRV